MKLLIESHYLPSLPVMAQFLQYETVYLEVFETYQKQTYRNRSHILTASGILMLTVPIAKTKSRIIKDIKIDYSQRWQQIHLRAIRSAYGKAPYFEFYFDDIEKIIMSNRVFLIDLNLTLMSKCLDFLKIRKDVVMTESYITDNIVGINDYRGHFARETIIPGQNETANEKHYQVFGHKFVTNLSIIDLLFNEGTNAKEILYKYKT